MEATRDHLSPSQSECPGCNVSSSPIRSLADDTLLADASGNLRDKFTSELIKPPQVIELAHANGHMIIHLHGNGNGRLDEMSEHLKDLPEANAIQSLVLAHACAGIDVQSAKYISGIDTAYSAIANNLDE